MCLYPLLIKNRRYTKTKKNGGVIPPIFDNRVLFVPVGCGKCMECMKKKSNDWKVRLQEEIKYDNSGVFVTLSFSDDSLIYLERKINEKGLYPEGYDLDNELATLGTRYFLERWRKKKKKSVKHWLTTELGSKNTERIHLHGLIFTKDLKTIQEKWQYGNIYLGKFVNEQTINYISKYITKTDLQHKEYIPKILTSAGIGNNYTIKGDWKRNVYRGKETDETYVTRTGHRLGLPIYYRNKIYSDEEREKLWIQKLDKQERWVNGIRFDVSESEKEYFEYLEFARNLNSRLGFGDNSYNWDRKMYEKQLREVKRKDRWTRVARRKKLGQKR